MVSSLTIKTSLLTYVVHSKRALISKMAVAKVRFMFHVCTEKSLR